MIQSVLRSLVCLLERLYEKCVRGSLLEIYLTLISPLLFTMRIVLFICGKVAMLCLCVTGLHTLLIATKTPLKSSRNLASRLFRMEMGIKDASDVPVLVVGDWQSMPSPP